MKILKLITLILGIAVISISCNDNSNELRVANSIDGGWSFTSPSTNGEFTVKDSTVISGSFSLQGQTYPIAKPYKISKTKIVLLGSGDNQLALFKPLINSDLTIITCTNLEYDTDTRPTTFLKETITIKKK